MIHAGTSPLGNKTMVAILAAIAPLFVFTMFGGIRLVGDARTDASSQHTVRLAHLLARDLSTIAEDDYAAECQRMLELPNVTGARIEHLSGRRVAEAVLTPEDEVELSRAAERFVPADGAGAMQCELATGMTPITAAGVPFLPDGAEQPLRLVVLTRFGRAAATGSVVARVGGVMAVLAVLSAGVAYLWWRRRALVPIQTLLQDVTAQVEATGATLTGSCEVEQLRQFISGLGAESEKWRQRAERLERRMNDRVRSETEDIARDLRRARKASWLDVLTGLRNRRYLEEKYPEVYGEAMAARRDLSVVMLDLDHFKVLNDTLGHAAGDELLTFTGELLRSCIRGEDMAVRYGGDEFALILPEVSAENAALLARRIQAMFNQRAKVMATAEPAPSMSAGVASIKQDGPTDADDLLRRADRALYAVKHARQDAAGDRPARRRMKASGGNSSRLAALRAAI